MKPPRLVTGSASSGWVATPKPGVLAALPDDRVVRVDAREDIRAGREPFARIMAAVGRLGADAALVVRAPFEPGPLYGVLGSRGFAHWTERHEEDDWSAWFYREPPRSGARAAPATGPGAVDGRTIRLDVRGLEPPLPMVRVLERLDDLVAGQQLEVLHDRRPRFLYPQLDDRGFLHETVEQGPGLVRITIRRGGGQP